MAELPARRMTASGVAVRRRRSALPAAGESVTTGRPAAVSASDRRIPVRPRRSRLRSASPQDDVAPAPRPVPAEAVAFGSPEDAWETPLPDRRRGPNPVPQLIAALACWGALASVVYYLDPGRGQVINGPARAAFVLALFCAIAFTLAPALYAVWRGLSRSRVLQEQAGVIATRQAVMLAAFVALNALLQMVRAWSALSAMLLLGMLAVIEIVALARR